MTERADAVCPHCGGRKRAGTTTFSVDNGRSLVVVRSVPALICEQCGEEWIDNETAQERERIVAEAQEKHTQVEIMALCQAHRAATGLPAPLNGRAPSPAAGRRPPGCPARS